MGWFFFWNFCLLDTSINGAAVVFETISLALPLSVGSISQPKTKTISGGQEAKGRIDGENNRR